jgi:putative endonuclease
VAERSIAAVLPRRGPYGKNVVESLSSGSSKRCMKYFGYILRSLTFGTYYYGSTSDLKKRLRRHNGGMVKSTKSKKPWILHYYEEFDSKTAALKRERFFKTIDGYNYLKQRGII